MKARYYMLVVGIGLFAIIVTGLTPDKDKSEVTPKRVKPSSQSEGTLNAVIDFKTMKVFSVERAKTNGYIATVVGWIHDGKVQQWILFLTPEDHNKLLEKFENYLIDRDG
jgi:hypothetical protein